MIWVMHIAKVFSYLIQSVWGLIFEFFLWKATDALIQYAG